MMRLMIHSNKLPTISKVRKALPLKAMTDFCGANIGNDRVAVYCGQFLQKKKQLTGPSGAAAVQFIRLQKLV
jgi:hypothetical protein